MVLKSPPTVRKDQKMVNDGGYRRGCIGLSAMLGAMLVLGEQRGCTVIYDKEQDMDPWPPAPPTVNKNKVNPGTHTNGRPREIPETGTAE